ncbi:MAG: hypothetical protein ACM3PU_00725 [Gemmatimonadota bacterium]
MNTTSTATRVAGIFFALLMTVAVLGATVAGMQSDQASGGVVVLDRVVVTVPAQKVRTAQAETPALN